MESTAPPTKRLRNVLFVTALDGRFKFGSMEEQLLAFARAFRDRGATFVPVFTALPNGQDAAAYEADGLPVAAVDLRANGRVGIRRLEALVRTHAIEAVNWSFYDALTPQMLWLQLRFPGVRHVFTSHDSRRAPYVARRGPVRRRLKAALLGRYEAVLAVSDFVKACLDEEGWWPEVTRFWHFVNTDRFVPCPEARTRVRAEFGAGPGLLIVAIGQLIPEKGMHVLLRSLAALPPETTAWLIGEGSDRVALEQEAAALGLGPRVRFLGRQPRVEPFLQAADVAVCPSIWGEAAGLVNLEAASCGVPMVASRVGGIPEFVLDGETGILVPPGDPAALAGALRTLMDHGALRATLGSQARAHAIAEFSTTRNLERNLDVFVGASRPEVG